jgi:hypothetical protein
MMMPPLRSRITANQSVAGIVTTFLQPPKVLLTAGLPNCP